jgi:hypothetical protein
VRTVNGVGYRFLLAIVPCLLVGWLIQSSVGPHLGNVLHPQRQCIEPATFASGGHAWFPPRYIPVTASMWSVTPIRGWHEYTCNGGTWTVGK